MYLCFLKFCIRNKGACWWFEWTETSRALKCCVGLHISSVFQHKFRYVLRRARTHILGSSNGFGKVNCMKPLLGVVGGRARGSKTKQTLRLTTQLHRCRQPWRISHRYKVQQLALGKLETQGAPTQTSVFMCCFGISQRLRTVIQLQFVKSGVWLTVHRNSLWIRKTK